MRAKKSAHPSVQRIAELQQLIADFAKVERMPQLANNGRRENDAEHSYGLALTAWFLAPKIAPELSLEKILCYALAHDIVELHAGDTFAFGTKKQLATKSIRENAALDQLKKDWPDFKELISFTKDYKNKVDEEALFVYSLDKILPPIMVNLGEKKAYWTRYKITREDHIKEKGSKISSSKHLAQYHERLLEWLENPDYYYKPNK